MFLFNGKTILIIWDRKQNSRTLDPLSAHHKKVWRDLWHCYKTCKVNTYIFTYLLCTYVSFEKTSSLCLKVEEKMETMSCNSKTEKNACRCSSTRVIHVVLHRTYHKIFDLWKHSYFFIGYITRKWQGTNKIIKPKMHNIANLKMYVLPVLARVSRPGVA